MNRFMGFFWVFAILFASCSNDMRYNSPLIFFSEAETYKIYANRHIELEEYEIYKPSYVYKLKNNEYLIKDQTNNGIIKFLNSESEYVISGINKGQGPNELLSPSNMQISGNEFFIYDIFQKRIHEIKYLNDSIYLSTNKELKMKDRLFIVNRTPEGIVATGVFDNAWIKYYDENSNHISSIDYPFFETTKNLTYTEIGAVYISTEIAFNSDFSKMVCASQKAGVISFSNISHLGINEYLCLKYHAPYVIPPRESGKPAIFFHPDNKVGFCGAATSDSLVFLLYSGRSVTSHNLKSFYCEHVLVYDWQGTPIKHFILDTTLHGCINYDSENKILYGISHEREGMIVEYDLSKILI